MHFYHFFTTITLSIDSKSMRYFLILLSIIQTTVSIYAVGSNIKKVDKMLLFYDFLLRNQLAVRECKQNIKNVLKFSVKICCFDKNVTAYYFSGDVFY